MVLDLEVEVGHPPVAERRRRDVRRVFRRVLDPVQVVVGVGHREVRVAQGEVGEDVGRRDLVVERVRRERRAPAQVLEDDAEQEHVAERHRNELAVPFGPERVARVEVHLPARRDEEARHGDEEVALQLQPTLRERPLGLGRDPGVERDERQRVEVDVVLELLGRRVVLVVLVPPPGAAHAAAHAVDDLLQKPVELDVARERVVARLVHEPAAAARDDAEDQNARVEVRRRHDEVRAQQVHCDDLADAVRDLARVGIEAALGLELRPQLGVARRQVRSAVAAARLQGGLVRRLLRERLEHLLRLFGPSVKLVERLRRVAVIGEEFHDGPAGMLERRHVVEVAVDEHVRVLLRRGADERRRELLAAFTHFRGGGVVTA
mmetsp:Transcript_986/g.2681  ORF Transcript_986/g.2681 Transcript_986/m.2681 type:complete len:377 (+) Transcript_986:272-1402(+)